MEAVAAAEAPAAFGLEDGVEFVDELVDWFEDVELALEPEDPDAPLLEFVEVAPVPLDVFVLDPLEGESPFFPLFQFELPDWPWTGFVIPAKIDPRFTIHAPRGWDAKPLLN